MGGLLRPIQTHMDRITGMIRPHMTPAGMKAMMSLVLQDMGPGEERVWSVKSLVSGDLVLNIRF